MRLHLSGSVLDVINEILHILAGNVDVVLLAEVGNSVGNACAGVCTLLGSHQEAECSTGDGTTDECTNVTKLSHVKKELIG